MRSCASLSTCRGFSNTVSGPEALAAAAMTGVATDGAGGTTHTGSSDCVNAITGGIEIDAGAAPLGPSARKAAFAPASLIPTFALGVAFAVSLALGMAFDVGLALGAIASGFRCSGGTGGTDGVRPGSPATACSIDVCCGRSTTETRAGTITTRSSDTSIGRSRQVKRKLGNPNPRPPKVKLKSSVCSSSESRSAKANRLRSRPPR
jgi:hypothetical protein